MLRCRSTWTWCGTPWRGWSRGTTTSGEHFTVPSVTITVSLSGLPGTLWRGRGPSLTCPCPTRTGCGRILTRVCGGETRSASTWRVGPVWRGHCSQPQSFPGDERDDFGQLTEFFCGQEDECTWVFVSLVKYLTWKSLVCMCIYFLVIQISKHCWNCINCYSGLNTEVALRKAKENVEKHYAVVGVLEELNKTLTVMEHYIPRFFKGAKDVYWSKCEILCRQFLIPLSNVHIFFSDEINVFSKINRNIYKPPVAEETKNIVRKNFTRELEFFDFCKQRLHKQYLALNLDNRP